MIFFRAYIPLQALMSTFYLNLLISIICNIDSENELPWSSYEPSRLLNKAANLLATIASTMECHYIYDLIDQLSLQLRRVGEKL